MRVPLPRLALRPVLSIVILVVVLLASARANAAPGDLDPSFGSGGIARTEFPGTYPEHALAVVLQQDGKIIAVGTEASGRAGVGIVRYLPDGTPDGSFGTGGLVVTDFPFPGVQIGIAAALQADGKLLVLGYAAGILRFNPDGSLDDSFADHGRLRLQIDGGAPTSNTIAVQPDGKILVLGNIEPPYPQPPRFVLFRLDESGATELVLRGSTVGRALALQPDGKIVVAGERLTRYRTDGSLDENFGFAGEVADANARAIAVNADGKLTALCGGTCVERFTAGGTFDTSFGDDGRAGIALDQLAVDVSYVELFALVAQPDGRVIAVGRSGGPFFARFDRNGHLDPSFGLGGVVEVRSVSNGFFDLVLQPDAKVVAIGGYGSFVAGRLLGDVCGDGVQQDGEACEDGNLLDGDGCDSNCRPTGCGNAIATAGEECDDGNLIGGDCCSPGCTFESLGSPCDDGDACTLGDSCQYGTCFGGAARDCDDGNGCTHDDCDPFAGLCRHEPSTDLVCPPALPRLDWFHQIWSRRSAVGDEEPHFGAQTVLAGDQLFVVARGEFYGANVQVLDAATGELRHIFTNHTPLNEYSELGPIAALGNDLVVVSTPPSPTGEEPPGPATVDLYDGATFNLRQRLVDPTPDTGWGWWDGTTVLAVAGRVLVVDVFDQAVYVFDPDSGALLHTLLPPPPEDASEFGRPVVALGSSVLVHGSGVVHLFDVASGALLQSFPDPTPGLGRFGDVIAPYGQDVLIGGRREDSVRLFDAATGALLRTFDDPDGVDRTFGTSVAVVGSHVVVGRDQGRVHVFDGATAAFRRTILDPSPSARGCFGRLLPVLVDRLAVSDPCANYGPYSRDDEVGVVYVFDPETGALIGVIPDEFPDYRDAKHAVLAVGRTIITQTYNDGDGGLQAYTSCIDGVVADGEECDDGNYVNGDGCDDNCTVTRCGNGLPTGDESCDDGNQVDDDECSNQCRSNVCGDGVVRRYYEQCDDGAANGTDTSCCTSWCGWRGDGEACSVAAVCGGAGVCAAGSCVATSGPCWPCGACDPERGCVAAPATDCRPSLAPRQSSLMIERHADPDRARLAWRWRKGAATPANAFGQPATLDSHGLCLYDESQATPQLLLGASVGPLGYCRDQKPCWQRFSHGALHRYRDATGAADGLTTIDLTPGDDGHAHVVVTGRGQNLHLPSLPLASPVRLQLRATNGECWEQTYSADGMGRNGPTRFRATGH